MYNISGYGLTVSLIASNTFPVGLLLNEWPDDQEAIAFPDIEIGDGQMGVNGQLITWSKAAPIKMTLSAIPDSPQDLQLAVLLLANRVGVNKIGARDVIQCVVVQGNLNVGSFVNGVIVSGPTFNGVQNTGRMTTKKYNFLFESPYAI